MCPKKRDPDGLFCASFFYSKDWSLFLFLKGVARPCRALKGHGCNGECLHSQRHPGHFSTWCFAPTPFIKFFFILLCYLHYRSLHTSSKLPIFAPQNGSTQAVRKLALRPRLYETLPRWFAIVGWLHDFSHCGSLLLLARDAARKSQNTSSVLVAAFGGHEFFVWI